MDRYLEVQLAAALRRAEASVAKGARTSSSDAIRARQVVAREVGAQQAEQGGRRHLREAAGRACKTTGHEGAGETGLAKTEDLVGKGVERPLAARRKEKAKDRREE